MIPLPNRFFLLAFINAIPAGLGAAIVSAMVGADMLYGPLRLFRHREICGWEKVIPSRMPAGPKALLSDWATMKLGHSLTFLARLPPSKTNAGLGNNDDSVPGWILQNLHDFRPAYEAPRRIFWRADDIDHEV